MLFVNGHRALSVTGGVWVGKRVIPRYFNMTGVIFRCVVHARGLIPENMGRVFVGGTINVLTGFINIFRGNVLGRLVINTMFNVTMVNIGGVAHGGWLYIVAFNRVMRVLGRYFFYPVIEVRGVGVFALYFFGNGVSDDEHATIFNIRGLGALILYNMFIASFATSI